MDVTETLRRIGLGIGTVLLAGGVVLLLVPDAAGAVPAGITVVQLVALLSVLLALWVVRTRYNTKYVETSVPTVELPLSTPTPGDEIDDMVYRLTQLREGTIEYRERIQERVAELAISVIMQREDCSREEAIGRLEDGSWTDDPLAASFFHAGGTDAGASSFVEQALERFTERESSYERQLRTTIDAVEDVSPFEFPASEYPHEDEDGVTQSMDPQAIIQDDDGERVTETTRYRSVLATRHWTGITAFGLVAFAVGLITAQPPLIVASAVGIGVAGYARAGSAPPLAALEVSRTVSDETPEPGDEIEVRVTVENTADSLMPDLRLIDRVPPTVQVVDGSARLGTALRSGGTATFSYVAVVERGEHDWPLQVLGRDAASALEREALIDTDTTVECVPRLKTTTEMPVRLQTSVYSGGVNTEVGGEGLEFFSVRDYQPGDPKRRIDWKTYARTGEFSTVDFREEHAARVVLLFDGRESSYVSSGPGEKHALDQSVEVAFDVFASLYDQGHLIGMAAYNGIPMWLGPSTGSLHLQRVRNLFVENPAISALPPDVAEGEAGRYVDPMTHVRRQLPEDTQIFLFSPLTDEYTYEVARRLDGSGHLVTVISPDPTTDRTVGQRLARLERLVLIKKLRDHGIRVVDWSDVQPLDVELEYAKRRWSA
jgi:uncharacterized repeat protein (TIGR01451 family)